MFLPFARAALILSVLAGSCGLASAGPSNDPAQVPGDDIFGFTSPTDVGKPGDSGFANENDGRIGKRDGRYRALNTKYEFSRTIADNWWLAGSLFGAYNHASGVTGIDDINRMAFDGASFELAHRVLERSAGNPFAVTLSIEPRWGRVDGGSGRRSETFNAALKVFVDAVVVPDRWFWAVNLQWAPQRAQNIDDTSQWLSSSTTVVSTALTYQFTPALFGGAEARYLASFDTLWPSHNTGYAIYLGPTLLWKITDKFAVNITYQPQIFGRSSANPDFRLDLDNFERAQFRLKAAAAF